MKNIHFLFVLVTVCSIANAQVHTTSNDDVGVGTTTPETKFQVDGVQTNNRISQSGGTYTELAQRTWGGSSGILFSAYAADSYVNGSLSSIGNTKYKFNASVFGSSTHSAKMLYTNHSNFGFFISPPSTGANQDIVWGDPVLWLNVNKKVGIGTNAPEANLHIRKQSAGIASQYATTIVEAEDAHLDITSSSSATWGSSINLIEGAAGSNMDMWSIVRQTTAGSGNSSLRFNFGTTNNHTNTNKLTIEANGNLGIGIESPEAKLHVATTSAGIKSQLSTAMLEATDAQLDLVSTSAGDWGSSINLIEGNGSSNADIWSIARRTSGGNSSLRFNYGSNNSHNNSSKVTFNASGSVGIGTSNTGPHKLAVEGSIGSREVKVQATGWSDFVFADDYQLNTLEEVENYIEENNHLSEIPSEAEVLEKGINLGEMDAKLLQKIEELTLYMIEMNKEIKSLKDENSELRNEMKELKQK